MKKLTLVPLAFVALAATGCKPGEVVVYVDHVRHVLDAPAPEPFVQDPTLKRSVAVEPTSTTDVDSVMSVAIDVESVAVSPEDESTVPDVPQPEVVVASGGCGAEPFCPPPCSPSQLEPNWCGPPLLEPRDTNPPPPPLPPGTEPG